MAEDISTLRTAIVRIIQDSSYTSTTIDLFINRALQDIAGDPFVFLPDLEDNDTVTTDTSLNYVALPSDFMKQLFRCYSTTNNREIPIFNSADLLFRRYSYIDQGGRVTGVARRGANLVYQRIPSSAETLRLHFFRKPTDDEIGCLPDHLAYDLVVNWVCHKINAEIYEGDDSQAAGSISYRDAEYQKARLKLIDHLGPPAFEPDPIADEIDWNSFFESDFYA